ncbi:hypothetical protein [Georgenia sp. SUBG003]|uniref:hypothetical protein n=1 Tax=Georgenia sp. SUBG003 TaxID=1497974 RepID=UPI003AB6B72B
MPGQPGEHPGVVARPEAAPQPGRAAGAPAHPVVAASTRSAVARTAKAPGKDAGGRADAEPDRATVRVRRRGGAPVGRA